MCGRASSGDRPWPCKRVTLPRAPWGGVGEELGSPDRSRTGCCPARRRRAADAERVAPGPGPRAQYRGPAHRRGPASHERPETKIGLLFYCLEDQITHRRCTYTLCVALHATARRQGSVSRLPCYRRGEMPSCRWRSVGFGRGRGPAQNVSTAVHWLPEPHACRVDIM